MRIGFQIEGAAELDGQLRTLPRRLQRTVVRQAVRAGQRPLQAAVRATALSLVGGAMGRRLAANVVIRAPARQVPGRYSLHVQLRRGVEAFRGPGRRSGRETYIPAAIEYGHTTGGTYVPPIPFARTAAGRARAEAIRCFTDTLRTGLLREAIKGRYPR